MAILISANKEICGGKPCINGLRYPVKNVLEWIASGMTHEQILEDYPDISKDDILAVIEYGAQSNKKGMAIG